MMKILGHAQEYRGVVRICGEVNHNSDCVEFAVVDGAVRIQSFNQTPPYSTPSKYVSLEALEEAVAQVKKLLGLEKAPVKADKQLHSDLDE